MLYTMSKAQRLFVVLLLVLNLCGPRQAQEIVDCTLTDMVTSVFNEPIDLTLSGVVHVYENVTINNITATTNNEFDKNYIDARLENATVNGTNTTNLIIYTTENFRRYAEEQTAVRITLKIEFGCDMGRERTLIFFQPIREGNYFRPTFSQDIYELIMPTPIFAGFDLTALMEISAKDADLTANRITFSSNDAAEFYVQVATKNTTSAANTKTFYAELRLQRIYLALATEMRFHIIATDNGVPPLSSNATVVIRTDPTISLPPTPEFPEVLVSAKLAENLTLQPFQVSLSPETFTRDVEFSLAGVDARLFAIGSVDYEVTVSLAQPLNRSAVKGKAFLQFELRASNRNLVEIGRTAIVVEVPSAQEHFHFERPLYEATIDELGVLQSEAISFHNATYSDAVVFSLDNATFFTLQHNGSNTVHLLLSPNFSMEATQNASHFVVQVVAALDDLKATAAVYIALPRQASAAPQFEKPLYHGKILEAPSQLVMETISLRAHSDAPNDTHYELIGDEQNLFVLIPVGPSVILLLSRVPSAQELRGSATVLLLTLAARTRRNDTASAVLAIEMPRRAAEAMPRVFTETWMVAQLEVNAMGVQQLNVPPVQLAGNFTVTQFNFTLEGPVSESFRVTRGEDDHKLYLFLLQPIPASVLQIASHVQLVLQAVGLNATTPADSLPLFVELPRTVCNAANGSNALPEFSSDEYIFAASPNQVGELGAVSATVQSATALIQYKIRIDDDHLLRRRLSINAQSGALMLLDYVDPGSYGFHIVAENMEAAVERSVRARLDVGSMVQCADGRPSVANALLVKHLLEEQRHHNVLNISSLGGDCSMRLESFQPNDMAYVYINASTGMLDALAIDRESSAFAAMTAPAIQVKLRLTCGNDVAWANVSSAAPDANIIPENIRQALDVTYLKLLISDINDNAPQFVYPTQTLHLGYPAPSISVNVFPQYLTQVLAIDPDDGENATIRYSLRTNQHFDIDSVTGIIYPKANALRDTASVQLSVQATDRAGVPGNATLQTTGPTIVVHRLKAEHFALLTFRNTTALSLEQRLQQLSQETGYAITLVKQGVMPLSSGRPQGRQAMPGNDTIVQKAWAYAFDQGQPIDFAQLQRKLQTLPNAAAQQLTVESFGAALSHSDSLKVDDASRMDPTPYIVVIVVLALIALGTGGYLLWHFYLGKLYCPNMSANNKLTTDIECESVSHTNSGGQVRITNLHDDNATAVATEKSCSRE